jgi:hypothetical protein
LPWWWLAQGVSPRCYDLAERRPSSSDTTQTNRIAQTEPLAQPLLCSIQTKSPRSRTLLLDIRQALNTATQSKSVQNVSPSLHIHSIAPLLRCSAAALQFYILYCSTAVLYHSTALLLYCSAIQLYCSTRPLHSTSRLHRSSTTSLHLYRLLLYYSSTIPSYHSTIPPHCRPASLPYHPPPQLYHPTSINSYQPYLETSSKPLKELRDGCIIQGQFRYQIVLGLPAPSPRYQLRESDSLS